MDKTKARVFTIFWFVSGAIWTFASVKRFIGSEDMTIVAIYVATAISAFVLAFVFYKCR